MAGDYTGPYRLTTLAVPTLIAVGAFAGAALRYALGLALADLAGTLAANVLGCALLGAVLHEATVGRHVSRGTRLLLGTGFVSSFTTYSTFALEAATAAPAPALGYVLASYGLGLAAVLLGRRVAGRWGRAPA